MRKWTAAAVVCGGLGLVGGQQSAEAGLYFFDAGGSDDDFGNTQNWNPDGAPGAGDLVVHNNGALPAVQISSDQSVDSLRLSDGGSVVQSGGTLTIANGVAGDNGLWVGEFGPNASSYTLNGGAIVINDPNDGFMVGRGGGLTGTFTLNAGTVTNTVGDTHIGLDGTAVWNQSGGTFNGAGVQVGRFASPSATVNLSGNAVWNVGLVLLADGHGVFNPRNSGPVDLKLTGGNVSYTSTGLVMMQEGNLTFDGTGGVSTMDLGGGQLLLNDGELYLVNLPSASVLGQTLVLLDNIGSFTGSDTQFDNAVDGTIYGDWEIDYTGSQVRLVSVVPEPASFALLAMGGLMALRRRNR